MRSMPRCCVCGALFVTGLWSLSLSMIRIIGPNPHVKMLSTYVNAYLRRPDRNVTLALQAVTLSPPPPPPPLPPPPMEPPGMNPPKAKIVWFVTWCWDDNDVTLIARALPKVQQRIGDYISQSSDSPRVRILLFTTPEQSLPQ